MEGAEAHGKLFTMPIYAALPPEQQAKVFEPTPNGMRKACMPSIPITLQYFMPLPFFKHGSM